MTIFDKLYFCNHFSQVTKILMPFLTAYSSHSVSCITPRRFMFALACFYKPVNTDIGEAFPLSNSPMMYKELLCTELLNHFAIEFYQISNLGAVHLASPFAVSYQFGNSVVFYYQSVKSLLFEFHSINSSLVCTHWVLG